VRKAMGKIIDFLEQDKIGIVLTQALRRFIIELGETFDWSRMAEFPQLQVIYNILGDLGLQKRGVQTIDVSNTEEFRPHPLPMDSTNTEFASIWSDELGRVFVVHSRCNRQRNFFIGVACTHAFAGEAKGTYQNPSCAPAFPLVGPDDIQSLEDSFDWELPPDLHQREVTFDDAYKRVAILGGDVTPPRGGSHYQVRFRGGRTWPLDRNINRIPRAFLKELEPITGHRVEVIKYVLIFGEWPKRTARFPT